MIVHPLIRTRPASVSEVVSTRFSDFKQGLAYPVPHGLNTSYFSECGPVSYTERDANIALAPSYNAVVDVKVNIPSNGLWVQTVTDKLMEIDAQIAIARSMKVATAKVARMESSRASLAEQMGAYPNFPLAILKIENGVTALYTNVRSLAKVFDPANELSTGDKALISALAGGGDVGESAITYASGLRGFLVATKPVDAQMFVWLTSLAPAIAAQPFWVMQTAGAHASEVDVMGVLELHMRLVSKLKNLGATMATSELSDVLIDAVQSIDGNCSAQSIHLAVDWFSGRYPYIGVASQVALVEGIHPTLVSGIYPEMSFDGRKIYNNQTSQVVASVVGSETWPTDQGELDSVARAAFILDKVLVGITAVLAQDDQVVSPALLSACGVGYLSTRLYWGVRNG